MQKEALKLAQEARNGGINTEIDLMLRSISKNLDYANKKGIPFVAILGENELKAGKIKVKGMKKGNEIEVSIKNFSKGLEEKLRGQ